MPDTPEQIVSELVTGAVGAMDIPEHLQDAAETAYRAVGDWLKINLPDGDWNIYPQGSMRLGTPVRPSFEDEHDLDAVAELHLPKEMIGKQELKTTVGTALTSYVDAVRGIAGAPTGWKEGGRCWTLLYAEQFHMDMLPAIPNETAAPSGIWITDRDLFHWQASNPIAFADWFHERAGKQFLTEREILAKRASVDIEDVPAWRVRSILQRAVQVLKVHRNAFFAGNLDLRPPSVIVTTLAAHAFKGGATLFDAVMHIAADMANHIERESGMVVVRNPVLSEENFADRWGADAERVKLFYRWLDDLQQTLDDARNARGGLDAVAGRLEQSFGRDPIRASMREFGSRRAADRTAGRLTVATTGVVGTASAATRVRPHTFHGR